ncbi:hypothetical protein T11_2363 [Trichinella zimbabwensis]|uniref:Uncharacterized protein n=1 Tax=Trichinella zimbabwensis TaxID=268475 RepID=A0A0V1HW42_9BILA|nr:hypothetical protein T11_2363 [Trichinella zimbabwensis]
MRERILSNREGTLNYCFLNYLNKAESKQILKNHFTFHIVGEIARTPYHHLMLVNAIKLGCQRMYRSTNENNCTLIAAVDDDVQMISIKEFENGSFKNGYKQTNTKWASKRKKERERQKEIAH